MSLALSGDTVAYLMGLGLDAEQMKGLIDRLNRDALAMSPPAATNGVNEERERLRNESTYAERKRAKDRERMRELREKQRQSRDIDGDTRDSRATSTATEGTAGDEPATPHAHVRDNLPKLVTTGLAASASLQTRDLDWPDGERPSRAYLDELEAALRAAAGSSLNSAAPKLFVVSPILGLAKTGAGPPCDLQADVFPAIRACAQRSAPGSVSNWSYFVPAIREARDRRLAGAPRTEQTHERPRPDRTSDTRAARRGVWAEIADEERRAATGGGS